MTTYDVAIVGARPAGAATALLLARAGHRVVVVDRDRYGTDTLSTHALMRGGVVQLYRWGVLDRIVDMGTPAIRRVRFDYAGAVADLRLDAPLYAPRRTVLDSVLVDAAREAGADVRFGVGVTGVTRDADGVSGLVIRDRAGTSSTIDAAVTVGADGRRSTIARAVDAPVTRTGTAATGLIYGHFDDVPADGYEWYFNADSGAGVIPTNDGRVNVFAGAPSARFDAGLLRDLPATFHGLLRGLSPVLADRVAAGTLQGPLRGFPGEVGWVRRPFGPGWALVGDSAYFKDPITAHGMTDALRDAELLARALDEGLRGVLPMQAALAGYERVRDDLSWTLFETTDAIAGHGRSMPELQKLHRQLSRELNAEAKFLEGLGPLPARAPALAAA
jgi:2-polyprenyl-6-methoxyphenol hydroxylase-like FAD-dependent oxidoreductase